MSSTESITSAMSRIRTTPCPAAAPDATAGVVAAVVTGVAAGEGVVAAVTPLFALALAVAPPVPLVVVVALPTPLVTALANDAGKPVLAAAELTGPRSVATINGAYAAAPNN